MRRIKPPRAVLRILRRLAPVAVASTVIFMTVVAPLMILWEVISKKIARKRRPR